MSMENYIFISGIPLIVCLILLALIIVCLFLLGRAYIDAAQENARLKKHNILLRQENSLLQAECYHNSLKVPEVKQNV